MKVFFALTISAAGVLASTSREHSSDVPVATSPERVAELRQIVDVIERASPVDEKPIEYVQVAPDVVVPAFVDRFAMIHYRWKGVVLRPSDIPTLGGGDNGFIRGVFPVSPAGYRIVEVDPPLRYLQISGDLYAPAFFDRWNGIVYQWRDTLVRRKELPPTAEQDELILPTGMSVSWIDVGHAEAPVNAPQARPDAQSTARGTGGATRSAGGNGEVPRDPERSTGSSLWIAALGALAGAAILVVLRRKKSAGTITH